MTHSEHIEELLRGLTIPADEKTIQTFDSKQLTAYRHRCLLSETRDNDQYKLVENEIKIRLDIYDRILSKQYLN